MRVIPALATAFFALGGTVGHPAYADNWQGLSWGMSFDEANRAFVLPHEVSDSVISLYGKYIEFEFNLGEFGSGSGLLTFGDSGLHRAVIEFQDSARCTEYGQRIATEAGPPKEVKKDEDPHFYRHLLWLNEARGTIKVLRYYRWHSPKNAYSFHCNLVFTSPAEEAEAMTMESTLVQLFRPSPSPSYAPDLPPEDLAPGPGSEGSPTALTQNEAPAATNEADIANCRSMDSDIALPACTRVLATPVAGEPRYTAFLARGDAYFGNGDPNRAIADYSEALVASPSFAKAYFKRAAAWRRQGYLDRAIADYGEVIRIDPISVDAYKARSSAHAENGDRPAAIADLGHVIRLTPQSIDGYYDRATLYRQSGDFDSAIADLGNVIRLQPSDARGYFWRGRSYRHKGDIARAIADYDEAQRVGGLSGVYFARGQAYLVSGALENASSDLFSAVYGDTKDPYPALWLDAALRRLGQPRTLADARGNFDSSAWPAPIVRLYLGEATPEDVFAAARDGDDTKSREQVCEANFYIAELKLSYGDEAGAEPLFAEAERDCPAEFIERNGARDELASLQGGSRPAAPATADASTGDALARLPEPETPAPAVADPSATNETGSVEIAFWNTIAQSKDRADFEAYLTQFPSGSFVALANNRLAALTERAAETPAAPTELPAFAAIAEAGPHEVHFTGKNGKKKVAGAFVRVALDRWTENNDDGADWSYRTLEQTDEAIELFDEARGVFIELDLKRKAVNYKAAAEEKLRRLYAITKVE